MHSPFPAGPAPCTRTVPPLPACYGRASGSWFDGHRQGDGDMMEALVAQRSLSFPFANLTSTSQQQPQTQLQAQTQTHSQMNPLQTPSQPHPQSHQHLQLQPPGWTLPCSWPVAPSPCTAAWAPDSRSLRPVRAATRPSGQRPRQQPAPVAVPAPASVPKPTSSTIRSPSSTSPASSRSSTSSSASASASVSSRDISPRSKPKMPGRPVKRPAGSGDDESPGHGHGPGPGSKVKLPRLERGPDDFSSVVKNRLQSYTRTGQACDRCKVSSRPISVHCPSVHCRPNADCAPNRSARFDATPSPKAAPTAPTRASSAT